MAHTDLLIYLPVAFWTFLVFWIVYLLLTGLFLPKIYKALRFRNLILNSWGKGLVSFELIFLPITKLVEKFTSTYNRLYTIFTVYFTKVVVNKILPSFFAVLKNINRQII
jgi:hypothetical protein